MHKRPTSAFNSPRELAKRVTTLLRGKYYARNDNLTAAQIGRNGLDWQRLETDEALHACMQELLDRRAIMLNAGTGQHKSAYAMPKGWKQKTLNVFRNNYKDSNPIPGQRLRGVLELLCNAWLHWTEVTGMGDLNSRGGAKPKAVRYQDELNRSPLLQASLQRVRASFLDSSTAVEYALSPSRHIQIVFPESLTLVIKDSLAPTINWKTWVSHCWYSWLQAHVLKQWIAELRQLIADDQVNDTSVLAVRGRLPTLTSAEESASAIKGLLSGYVLRNHARDTDALRSSKAFADLLPGPERSPSLTESSDRRKVQEQKEEAYRLLEARIEEFRSSNPNLAEDLALHQETRPDPSRGFIIRSKADRNRAPFPVQLPEGFEDVDPAEGAPYDPDDLPDSMPHRRVRASLRCLNDEFSAMDETPSIEQAQLIVARSLIKRMANAALDFQTAHPQWEANMDDIIAALPKKRVEAFGNNLRAGNLDMLGRIQIIFAGTFQEGKLKRLLEDIAVILAQDIFLPTTFHMAQAADAWLETRLSKLPANPDQIHAERVRAEIACIFVGIHLSSAIGGRGTYKSKLNKSKMRQLTRTWIVMCLEPELYLRYPDIAEASAEVRAQLHHTFCAIQPCYAGPLVAPPQGDTRAMIDTPMDQRLSVSCEDRRGIDRSVPGLKLAAYGRSETFICLVRLFLYEASPAHLTTFCYRANLTLRACKADRGKGARGVEGAEDPEDMEVLEDEEDELAELVEEKEKEQSEVDELAAEEDEDAPGQWVNAMEVDVGE